MPIRRVKTALIRFALLPAAFLASCGVLIPVAANVVDPLTHWPLDAPNGGPFPILEVHPGGARLRMLEASANIPPISADATYLISLEKIAVVEEYLNHHHPGADASWALKGIPLAPGHQKIELFLFGDGYSGGVYEATRNKVTPLYRKETGPGFALIFGGFAFAMNLTLWGAAVVLLTLMRRRSRRT